MALSTRPFRATDVFTFTPVNLDHWTETYGTGFYLHYLAAWPDLCSTIVNHNGDCVAYMIGKAEGVDANWHGHVTAVTVSHDYRRRGLSTLLMSRLQSVSDTVYNAYFVDLYVRATNYTAVALYKLLGYVIYRQVINYYSNLGEDAYDMRLALTRDPERKSMQPMQPLRQKPTALD